MFEEEKNLNYLFNEVPIYSKEKFKILDKTADSKYKINRQEFNRLYKYLNTLTKKLIINCVWCNKALSFDYNRRCYNLDKNGFISKTTCLHIAFNDEQGLYYDLNADSFVRYVSREISDKDLVEENYYVLYILNCNNIPKHTYTLNLLIRVNKDKIEVTKIGQYPMLLEIKGFDFDKYKDQLEKYNAYEDYKNAALSRSENFSVGAYAYLRRVYEKQLNYYIEKENISLSDKRIETKIKAVKNMFDPRIHEHLKNLYQILSIGIHELSEEQSKEYYEYLKAMIDMQLQFEKEKDEKEKQTKMLNKKISNIANFLNKNNGNK